MIVVQLLPADAAAAVQFATGTLVVTTGAGQLVAVQLLPATAAVTVQLATGVLGVTTELQLVVV